MKKIKEVIWLFLSFFKIGLFTFGGGYAMIPLIEHQFVSKSKVLTNEEFINIIAIAESTPGPIAVNSATYIGYKKSGVLGSIFATIGVVLPSFFVISIISYFLNDFMKFNIVKKAFGGIQCGVCLLIVFAGIKLFKKMEKNLINIILFVFVFISILLIDLFSFNFSTVYFVIIGLLSGIVITKINDLRRNKNDLS